MMNDFTAQAAQSPGASFETAFSTKGEPASLHYQVAFSDAKGPHDLEVWRDGASRLRRRTDSALDSYVVRDAADATEYRMTVVDYQRRITTRIDRGNLIKLGHFTEWFDLSHGLRHPVGDYRLQTSQAPDAVPAPLAPCKWYALTQKENDTHRICWSTKSRLPLMIWSEQRGVVWRVTKITPGPIPPGVFALNDAGFVRNDADSDIDND